MTDDERTLMDDAREQLATFHKGSMVPKDPKERAAWLTALRVYNDLLQLQDECRQADMGGQAVREALEHAMTAVYRIIAMAEGN